MHSELFIVTKEEQEKSLEDFFLKEGDVFMVEMKFGEQWPRDAQGGDYQGRDWRNFEYGDLVDVFDVIFLS